MNIEKEFASDLKKERQKRNYTQKEAAELIGISRSYFSDIENAKRIPNGRIYLRIKEIFPFF